MRIAWLHSHLLNPNSGGSRFVIDYADGLQMQHGHQVTIVCDVASATAREQVLSKNLGLVELDDCSTNSPLYWLTLPWRIARKRRALARRIAEFDVVLNSMFPMSWLAMGLPLRKVQICYEPFAFFYDQPFLMNFKASHRWFFKLAKILYASRDRAALRSMDRVITINKTNVPKLRQTYGVEAEVVYAGIDTDLYQRAPSAAITALRSRSTGAPLLFHSTDLTVLKGSFALLDVLARLTAAWPTLKLVVTVYVHDPAGVERFLQRVRELNLQRHVDYLGLLPREELPLYYSAVDFVCQPSLNQPASWPLKEALICGTPIIGGVESEEVETGVNGARIDVRDVEAAVVQLDSLFRAREQLDVRTSADSMRSHYSRSACVAQLNGWVEALHAPLPQ